MPDSNRNWVCFECRFVKRESTTTNLKPKCPSCGDDLYCLGHKVAIPKKENRREWIKLKNESRRRDIATAETRSEARVRFIHETEKLIKHQESLTQNKERRKYIRQLRKRLTEPEKRVQ